MGFKAKRLCKLALGPVLLLMSVIAMAAGDEVSTVNMSPGVTEVGQQIFDLHMIILWICVVIGVVVFSGNFGGAISPILAGYIFDVTGSYQLVFLLLTGMAAVGLGMIGDLRQIPSLARLSKNYNYRASVKDLDELLFIL